MHSPRATLRKPSTPLLSVLAKNICDARRSLDISQEELARRCGLHRAFVGSIERCERNVTLATLEVIASALGVSVPDILTRIPDAEGER